MKRICQLLEQVEVDHNFPSDFLLAADIFDLTQDRSAPVSTAASSSVPPPRTRGVTDEGATSAARELGGIMAVQLQQQQDKFNKTRDMFE